MDHSSLTCPPVHRQMLMHDHPPIRRPPLVPSLRLLPGGIGRADTMSVVPLPKCPAFALMCREDVTSSIGNGDVEPAEPAAPVRGAVHTAGGQPPPRKGPECPVLDKSASASPSLGSPTCSERRGAGSRQTSLAATGPGAWRLHLGIMKDVVDARVSSLQQHIRPAGYFLLSVD